MPADDGAPNDPHASQLPAPAVGANVCLAHGEHTELPTAAKRPAPHDASVLLPLHECPEAQAEHEVRVLAEPPAEDEPTAHVVQLLAPAALNLESAPHCVCVLLPSHEW